MSRTCGDSGPNVWPTESLDEKLTVSTSVWPRWPMRSSVSTLLANSRSSSFPHGLAKTAS